MKRPKFTIVGAGNVGAAATQIAATQHLGDIVLVDIVEGLAAGKALDLAEAAPIQLYDCKISGDSKWDDTAGSDIVIVTSGLPRKPGMSRDDLLAKNTAIVRDVAEKIKRYSPDSFVIVVCNPLDAMVYAVSKVTGFDKNRIVGMAGALDSARFNCFIAAELGCSVEDIQGLLLGGHGDDMVPLPRYTSVRGIPLTELMDSNTIRRIVERTRKGGIEIVNLLGYSAYYAPAAGAVKMAEAIIRDKKSLIPCCAYCLKQYNAGGYFVGVPAVLGAGGVEKIIELDLNDRERAEFQESLAHVKYLVNKVDTILA
ncbi:MAG: malate dehydrogenase [Planctomycetota bacterium]